MVEEDVILNLSMKDKNNIQIKSNIHPKNLNQKNIIRQNNPLTKDSDYKPFLLTNDNELFSKTDNYSYKKINSKYPLKIKKMSESDIIIKEDDSKNKININKYQNSKVSKEFKDNKYKCEICNKSYRLKNSYQKHLLTHKTKKFKCDKCHASFCFNSKLKRHNLIHTDIKDFKCNICDTAFNLKYNLKVHMRIHNNEKPYICGYPGCFSKFSQQNNLTTHMKIHNNNTSKDDNDEINLVLNYHNNIIKFCNNKKLKSKLLELNILGIK